MILTCPECASRYFVDDARIGPAGRTVRCASCGASWRASAPEPDPDLILTPSPAEAAAASAADGGPDAPLPGRIRAEALEKKKRGEALAVGAVWGLLGAAALGLVGFAVLFRVDVVRLWPKTASAYALAHLPVNPTGLALENVQGQPNLIGGHAALSVTGSERNVAGVLRPALPVRVTLYDKSNRRLASAVATPRADAIGPGAARPFSVDFIDPPTQLSNFMVEFAFDRAPARAPVRRAAPPSRGPGPAPVVAGPQRSAAAAPIGPRAQPVVRAIAAPEAKPLPADSPYALPPGAIQQASH